MPVPSQNPYVGEWLLQTLGVQGSLPLSVDEIVAPVAVVAQREDGIRAIALTAPAAGGAGTFSKAFLVADTRYAIDIHIDSIIISNTAGSGLNFEVRVLNGALVGLAAGSKAWRDGRWPGAPTVFAGTLVDATTPGTAVLRVHVPTGSARRVDIAYTLAAATTRQSLQVTTPTANVSFAVTWLFREAPRTATVRP